ncbi:MAG: helix-turn-helix transcriptional regulator, partial [Thermoplasmata archaeon]|nr:helix-turn-helix transcriptional regulator [Thermoplasmata archaeon]
MQRFTVQDRILVHLLDHRKRNIKYAYPVEVAQNGIARALAVERSNIPYAVDRLKKKELVTEEVAPVEGEKRRRKVYDLTQGGYEDAKGILAKMESIVIPVIGEEGKREVTLADLAKKVDMSITSLLSGMRKDGPVHEEDLIRLKTLTKGPMRMVPPLPPLRHYCGREETEGTIASLVGASDPPAIFIYGIAGVGKTTLAHHLIEESLGDRRVWWWKIHLWDTPRTVLASLSEFLLSGGKGRLMDLVSSAKILDINEAAAILADDIKDMGPLLVFDDCHSATAEVNHLFRALLERTKGPCDLIFLGRERGRFYDRREV